MPERLTASNATTTGLIHQTMEQLADLEQCHSLANLHRCEWPSLLKQGDPGQYLHLGYDYLLHPGFQAQGWCAKPTFKESIANCMEGTCSECSSDWRATICTSGPADGPSCILGEALKMLVERHATGIAASSTLSHRWLWSEEKRQSRSRPMVFCTEHRRQLSGITTLSSVCSIWCRCDVQW